MTNAIPMPIFAPTVSPQSNQKTFLMCKPLYFNVTYVINPWMQGNENAVSQVTALSQWNRLHDEIAKHAKIELLQPVDGLPDMVFTANAGMVIKNANFVWLSAFVNPERQREEEHFFRWFMQHGFQVLRDYIEVDRNHTHYGFEGAGDGLQDSTGTVWLGHGMRSTRASNQRITSFFNDKECHALTLVDPRFYHLDTCFCPLSSGHILWFPEAFSEKSQQLVRSMRGPVLIDVKERDAVQFACNAVEPAAGQLIMPYVSKSLNKALNKVGYQVTQLELSEFIKSGGAAKCLTLEI